MEEWWWGTSLALGTVAGGRETLTEGNISKTLVGCAFNVKSVLGNIFSDEQKKKTSREIIALCSLSIFLANFSLIL